MTEEQLSFLLNADPCRKALGTQGTRANVTGAQAEDVIYCIIKERGYQVQRHVSIGCQSIYGTGIEVDFLAHGIPGFSEGLILESKWQSTGGSVDQKYPYLVNNIQTRYPYPTIIVLSGGGMKPGAIDYLKRQVDGTKLVGVYTFEEFLLWAMNNL